MHNLISASILSADFSNLQNEIKNCELAGVDWIHVDVMDGHFVPNITMGPFIVEACRKITSLPLDCHLMIENPELFIDAFAKAGASYITIHPENNPLVAETLVKIRSLGCKAGIAVNPSTQVDVIRPLVGLVDLILVMTVNPGYSGQEFMPDVLLKISEIAEIVQTNPNHPLIEVDGGINPETISLTRDAGANVFVSASAIFCNPQGILTGVKELRNALV